MISGARGSRIFIGTTIEATDLQEFEADSYVEVGEVENLGEYGDESERVTFTALADGRTRSLKGPRDAGVMNVVCGSDSTDEGQTAMKEAEAEPFNFNFRVELNDRLTIDGTPTISFFRGQVMSKRRNVGTASDVVRHNFQVAINSEIIDVDPT
jgi:hypothetical protein